MTEADTSLRGWKAIADYLDVSVRTAQAYHRRLQLPIKDSATSSVCANPIDLERWRVTRLASALERFSSVAEETNLQLPLHAEVLFYLFLNKQDCEALVGDLEERYKLIYRKFGRRRANLPYWFQTFISLRPIIWAGVRRYLMKPAATIAGLAAVKGLISHEGWLAWVVGIVEEGEVLSAVENTASGGKLIQQRETLSASNVEFPSYVSVT